MSRAVLYHQHTSSASYRVRIALHLLEIPFQGVRVDLVAGEQHAKAHMARNPQGIVPVLEIDGLRLTQSVAIIEYLNETRQAGFLPADPAERARLRALAGVIAMEIQPVCNLSVATRAGALAEDSEAARLAWIQFHIRKGLVAFETLLAGSDGPFCHGVSPGLADFCLIPQLFNANRWDVDHTDLTRICAVRSACEKLAAFAAAAPGIS